MHLKITVLTCSIFLLVNISPTLSCSNVGKNAGQGAAREIKEASAKSAETLRKALEDASTKLERAMDKGVEATKEVVKELAGSISELAKSVSIKIDSNDLKDAGKAATENLRDAIKQLSENWNLSLDTADLKDVGAEAAKHLSEALQNINVVVKLYIDLDVGMNVVTAVMYISIAFGIGFSVCCVAMVISLKSCRKCTAALFTVCVDRCGSRDDNQTSNKADGTLPSGQFIKNANRNNQDDPRSLLQDNYNGRGKVYNELEVKVEKKNVRQSMAGFGGHKFANLKNFWNNPQPNTDY